MRLGTFIVIFIILVCNVGCLSPLILNTMGPVASSSPVAFNNSGGGQGESFWIAKYDHVIAATLRAGETPSLEVKEKKL